MGGVTGRVSSLNPLLSEAGFSTFSEIVRIAREVIRLNPLLSEAGFSTRRVRRCVWSFR